MATLCLEDIDHEYVFIERKKVNEANLERVWNQWRKESVGSLVQHSPATPRIELSSLKKIEI